MIILDSLFFALSILLLFYASFVTISILAMLLIPSPKSKKQLTTTQIDIACVVTAYRDLTIALPLLDSVFNQNYSDFHIYLVADRCIPHPDLPVSERLTVIYPDKPLDSKVSSLKVGLAHRKRNHDAVLVLDPDNLLHPDSLAYLSHSFSRGNNAVQGRRTAKNLDTRVACLDALGEIYYNFIHKELPDRLGSSATISGSGMLVETGLFEQYLADLDTVNSQLILAEDKILQNALVAKGIRIAYQKNALIFDEKSSSAAQVQKQRTRWLKSYFDHLKDVCALFSNKLASFDWNGVYFSVMTSTPPLIFLTIGVLITLGYGLFANSYVFMISAAVIFMTGINWFAALVFSNTPVVIWKAIPFTPVFAGLQVLSLFGFKQAKTDFLVTKHDKYLDFDQVWRARKNDFPDLKDNKL
ncbi:glycosyltransferase family 2 protein [Algoriphagus sp. AGSA1]|uniref:glycosyltransferase n=1 Tax=Algoriphagus sp. AGSA1 TaxID=2907213 RepID=UPI001F20DC77|nr:glycosyltransferase [Algoriphagus sp. AGSA1]MCE7053739.1 glycosyltransferase family 2 protein [Algoriphagus sp. AGSA1]